MAVIKCINCKSIIPEQRLKMLPHTKECVECSSEEAKGAVDIVYHKTGNTIQIMDKAQADAINKSARRSGFGSLRAMKGGSGGGDMKVTLGTTSIIPRQPTQEDFEKTGQEMMQMMDWKERQCIIDFLTNKLTQRSINGSQFRQLNEIVDQFMPEEKKPIKKEEEIKIDEETQWAFKNWKNSRAFK